MKRKLLLLITLLIYIQVTAFAFDETIEEKEKEYSQLSNSEKKSVDGIDICITLMELYKDDGDINKARKYAQKAYNNSKKASYIYGIARSAEYYCTTAPYEDRKSIAITGLKAAENGELWQIAINLCKFLETLHRQEGNEESSKEYAGKKRRLEGRIKLEISKRVIEGNLDTLRSKVVRLENTRGNTKQHIERLEEHNNTANTKIEQLIEDSIAASHREKGLIGFIDSKNQVINDSQQKNNELGEENNNLRNVLFGFLTVLLFLTILLYVRNKQLKESNKHLRLLKSELSHRVKNSLVVISSQIDNKIITLDEEDHKKTIEILNEFVTRIKAVQLLHNQLQDTNETNKIDFQAYLEDLTKYIKSSSSYEDELFITKIEVEKMTVGIEVANKIGLILTELALNAIKYNNKEHNLLEINVSKIENNCILNVIDNGIGMTHQTNFNSGLGFVEYEVEERFKGKLELLPVQEGTHWQITIPINSLNPNFS